MSGQSSPQPSQSKMTGANRSLIAHASRGRGGRNFARSRGRGRGNGRGRGMNRGSSGYQGKGVPFTPVAKGFKLFKYSFVENPWQELEKRMKHTANNNEEIPLDIELHDEPSHASIAEEESQSSIAEEKLENNYVLGPK